MTSEMTDVKETGVTTKTVSFLQPQPQQEFLQPLGGYITAEYVNVDVSTGGIILPDSETKRAARQFVIVTAVGEKIKSPIQVGQKLLIQKFGASEFTINKKETVLIHEDDVLGIVHQKPM